MPADAKRTSGNAEPEATLTIRRGQQSTAHENIKSRISKMKKVEGASGALSDLRHQICEQEIIRPGETIARVSLCLELSRRKQMRMFRAW